MLLKWDGEEVRLENEHDFGSFKVVIADGSDDVIRASGGFEGVGHFAGDNVAWISERALRSWKPFCTAQDWQTGLDAMLAKAAAHGWVDAASGSIRAHVEFAGRKS